MIENARLLEMIKSSQERRDAHVTSVLKRAEVRVALHGGRKHPRVEAGGGSPTPEANEPKCA